VIEELGPHAASAVAAFVRDAGVPGAAVAIVMSGEPPWSFAYGVADVRSGSAIGPRTPLRVGSLTKPFTAAAILALADDGLIGLDDPVVSHLPEFRAIRSEGRADPADVRVTDLVAHRAGLPLEADIVDEEADRFPPIEEILDRLGDTTMRVAPGVETRYSNLGYQLLGEIVARRSGTTYDTFVTEALLEPLQLTETSFERPKTSARGHRARAFTDHAHVVGDRRKRTNADGGLWSSALDQARWIRAQLDGARGAPDLRRTHGPVEGSDRGGVAGHGLGWFRERRGTRTVVYHGGSTPGFAGRLAFSPSLGGGAVVLANGEASVADVLGRVLDLVLDALEGALPSEPAPPLPPAPAAVPYPDAWDELIGFYAWPGSSLLFRLEVREGRLRLVDLQDPGSPVALDAVGDDRFVAVGGGWAGESIVVRRDDLGRIRGLRLGSWFVTRLVEATAI
jgi:CubicO group peptidase (beta-lactamase class C family)